MRTPYDVQTDGIIQALIAEAAADPNVIGLVLTGSRAVVQSRLSQITM